MAQVREDIIVHVNESLSINRKCEVCGISASSLIGFENQLTVYRLDLYYRSYIYDCSLFRYIPCIQANRH